MTGITARKAIFAATTLGLLGACGGSTTGAATTYADLVRDINAASNNGDTFKEGGGLSPVAPSAFLIPGTATYTGEIAMLTDPARVAAVNAADSEEAGFALIAPSITTPDLIGSLTINATLTQTAGTFTGTAANFRNSSNQVQSGALAISSGTLSIADEEDDAATDISVTRPTAVLGISQIAGTLTDATGVATAYSGGLFATVFDDNGPVIAGVGGSDAPINATGDLASETAPFVVLFTAK